tara:strand:- start:54956 stop:56125 length:1170 start_codon:yes stop_codon:yes gene_type:complete
MAANHHEHFYLWFHYDALKTAYSETYGLSLKDWTENYYATNKSAISPNVVTFLSGPNQLHTRSFFQFTDKGSLDTEHYRFVEAVRKNLFKSLLKQDRKHFDRFLELAIQETLKQLPIADKSYVELSTSATFFKNHAPQIYRNFMEQGAKVNVLYSYPRKKLLNDSEKKFQNKLHLVSNMTGREYSGGIDLSGSLDGAIKDLSLKEIVLLENRLMQIFESLSSAGAEIFKIHAFETESRRGFYRALWSFLDSLSLQSEPLETKMQIRFGHFATLSEGQIFQLFLINNALMRLNMEITFDYAYRSNHLLTNVTNSDLLKKLALLRSYGFKIYLGSDGGGILGESARYHSQLKSITKTARRLSSKLDRLYVHNFVEQKKQRYQKLRCELMFQ